MSTKILDIDQFLWPATRDDFMTDFFQKRPYVLHRDDPHFYDGLFSLADVMLLAFSIKAPEIYRQKWLDLLRKDQHAPESKLFNEKGIIPAQVLAHYQQGYTLVLNYLESWWPSTALLCRNLEASLSNYTSPLLEGKLGANIFLTPSGTQAFLPHYDRADVFILQLEGSKQWNLYNQLEKFPLQSIPDISSEILGDPIQTPCLNPGDMLYMPAGYPHEAFAKNGSSMHLSISVTPNKWNLFLSKLITKDEHTSPLLPLEPPATSSAPPPKM